MPYEYGIIAQRREFSKISAADVEDWIAQYLFVECRREKVAGTFVSGGGVCCFGLTGDSWRCSVLPSVSYVGRFRSSHNLSFIITHGVQFHIWECYNALECAIMLTTEQLSAAASIGISGKGAVGKEQVAAHLAPILDMVVINTGKAARAASVLAHECGMVEGGRAGAMRLRPDAAERIRDWATMGSSGLHFKVIPRDLSAHIFFDDRDMTAVIQPKRYGYSRLAILEPTAALIATTPVIRKGLYNLWRRASIQVGGGIMITKNIDAYLPEAHARYHLFVTDPRVSAGYRLMRGNAATGSIADELEYLRRRDANHEQNGLEVIPTNAMSIDMTNRLLWHKGIGEAAAIVLADLPNRIVKR